MGFAVVHDRSKLGMAKSVPAELASRWQERYPLAGAVVRVRERAVHLGRFEKLPIHGAKTITVFAHTFGRTRVARW
ncbi:hypothetical protein ACWGE0_42940 [Lentzea sp. NPDC054927]